MEESEINEQNIQSDFCRVRRDRKQEKEWDEIMRKGIMSKADSTKRKRYKHRRCREQRSSKKVKNRSELKNQHSKPKVFWRGRSSGL